MTNRTKLDDLQLALDVAGLEPTIGTAADGANVVISLLRAAKEKESDAKKKHLLDAGISAVSMIPFADVVKLLKLRKLRKVAVKGARAVKTGAKETPKSYSLEELTELGKELDALDEGWFGDFGKRLKKAFTPKKPKRNPAVAYPKKRMTAIQKDPYNSLLYIQKMEREKTKYPQRWTPEKEKLLNQFKVDQRSYLKNLPVWVQQNLARIPMGDRIKIINATKSLTGTAQLQKQIELIKQYAVNQAKVKGLGISSAQRAAGWGLGNDPTMTEIGTRFFRKDTEDPDVKDPFKYDPSLSFSRERQHQLQKAERDRMKYLRRLPSWADYHLKYTLPRNARNQIENETKHLVGISQIAKKIQLVKQWMEDNKDSNESITKEELMNVINELVREEMNVDEGYGWVHPKDIAKDPKHTTNKTTGKNQRWTISYQSASDIEKHGKTAKTPVNESDYHLPARVGSAFSGRASEKDPHSMKDKCPRCRGQLKYVADIGAPGHGQSWECPKCGKGFVKLGGTLIDPSRLPKNEPPPWELDPSDVMEGINQNHGSTPNESIKIAELIGGLGSGEGILFFTNAGVNGPMIHITKRNEQPGQPETYDVEDHKKHKQVINRESQLEKLADIILQVKLTRYMISGGDSRMYQRTPGALPLSKSQDKISKKELNEVIRELIDEVWTSAKG